MAHNLSGEELTTTKQNAISWIEEQRWINDVWVEIIRSELSAITTLETPVSSDAIYHRLSSGIIDLSCKMTVDGGIKSIDQAFEQHEAYILRMQIELLIVLALLPDHSLPKRHEQHPWVLVPQNHVARYWYINALAEVYYLSGQTEEHRDISWTRRLVSRRVVNGDNDSDVASEIEIMLIKKMNRLKGEIRAFPPRTKKCPFCASNASDEDNGDEAVEPIYGELKEQLDQAKNELVKNKHKAQVYHGKYHKYKRLAGELTLLIGGMHSIH